MQLKPALLALAMAAAVAGRADTLPVAGWLRSPALRLAPPAFAQQPGTHNQTFGQAELLAYPHHDFALERPADGAPFPGGGAWAAIQAADGAVALDSDTPATACVYLCAYLWAEHWCEVEVEVASNQAAKVWVDGDEIGAKASAEGKDEPGRVTRKVKLERGNHRILVKALRGGEPGEPWTVSGAVVTGQGTAVEDLRFGTSPAIRKHVSHTMVGIRAAGVSLSAAAKHYAITFRDVPADGKSPRRWTEIRRQSDDRSVYVFADDAEQLQWMPRSERMSYVARQGDRRELRVLDAETGAVEIVARLPKECAGHAFARDERRVVYTVAERDADTPGNTRRYANIDDRAPGYRDRAFLHLYDLDARAHTRLTAGALSTYLQDISPDGARVAFTTERVDYSQMPFSRQAAYVMDLRDMSVDTLWDDKQHGVSLQFSPDGGRLLCQGGPSAFGAAGENLGRQPIANQYDNQLYIYDLASRQVEPITRDFDPSVEWAQWSAFDGDIYLLATAGDRGQLFRHAPGGGRFEPLTDDRHHVTRFSLAQAAPVVAYYSSTASQWGCHRSLDLRTGRGREYERLEEEIYRGVELGECRDYDVTTAAGDLIRGRVYLPPGYDAAGKYPALVYYYGGTTPVMRGFGTRWPYNLWAGAGYVVYVLQPSGAVGYGQEFSAAHVNNWGTTVADQIIECAGRFLADHPAVDTARVGCLGASYGGFMTMLLTTRTTMFAAAISHAGISSIPSYWGEGYWGVYYNTIAAANSYPWDSTALYVGQSALFNADKIDTPLLLLHGDSDTNVPPGESIQLFAALKVLGREVEMVTIKGENHIIHGFDNRVAWHNTMMAWWEWRLKGHRGWWDELYPPRNY